MTSKAARLHHILRSEELEFFMEAHNGLSAQIVEESGFSAIWASGLALSAQFGVRDNNEASWTQIVEMLEFMADATSIPILLDGDTGYGNFNNLRRLVRKLEQRGIAGVCIEDKVFPKSNSFLNGQRQPLADIDEFCGKIRAGKDSQESPNFCLVARVEALIAGWGLEEALKRAERYHDAGADAILIHSRSRQADQVLQFAKQWERRCPLVIVPTTYFATPVEAFHQVGISNVIWANHTLRASILAMQKVTREIQQSRSVVTAEERIAPLREVFRLQGASELEEAETRYGVSTAESDSVVILAATRGEELGSLTHHQPKAMLEIAGKPLLAHLVETLKSEGLHDIQVVLGYCPDSVTVPGIETIINESEELGGELASLSCAQRAFTDKTLILYGDLLFRSYILRAILEFSDPVTIVVDSAPCESGDLVYCSQSDQRSVFGDAIFLKRVSQQKDDLPEVHGRFAGILRLCGPGRNWVREGLSELSSQQNLPDLLNYLVGHQHPVRVFYIHGHCMDVNDLSDLPKAEEFERGWSGVIS